MRFSVSSPLYVVDVVLRRADEWSELAEGRGHLLCPSGDMEKYRIDIYVHEFVSFQRWQIVEMGNREERGQSIIFPEYVFVLSFCNVRLWWVGSCRWKDDKTRNKWVVKKNQTGWYNKRIGVKEAIMRSLHTKLICVIFFLRFLKVKGCQTFFHWRLKDKFTHQEYTQFICFPPTHFFHICLLSFHTMFFTQTLSQTVCPLITQLTMVP